MTKKPKQSLAEWVTQNTEDLPPAVQAKFVRKPDTVASTVIVNTPKATTRYITLNEWAASQFSRVPHYNTLIRWANEGRIQPQPVKIGRAWQVRPHAEYVCD